MEKNIDILIDLAIKEDLNSIGDITTSAIFESQETIFYLISKNSGILCGIEIFKKVFLTIDNHVKVELYFNDKDKIKKGDKIAKISGKVLSILQAERIAINFLSFLSGISTKTSIFVKESKGKIKILDTRKTLPAYRLLSKYAVQCGGGENHRYGLYDMVLIKDNHQDAAGGIVEAVNKIKSKWNNKFKIEVEVRNLDEVKQALSCDIDIIMLDNMKNSDMKKAVKIINKKALVEASGNMNLKRIKRVSKCGIDFISFGELTHSVTAFDFSLIKVKSYENN